MVNRILIAVLLGHIVSASVLASSVAYSTLKAIGLSAHVVTVNLADSEARVTVALARGGTGKSESFRSIVRRSRPAAAITGTFFDTRTLIPTGDIAVFGKVVHKGCIGSALCIGSDNKASIVSLTEGRKQGWSGYETVLCCGPTLVANGVAAVNLHREGFGNSLYAPATRTAVAISKSGKLLLVAVNTKTTLQRFAKLLAAIGAKTALCLDGGSSTGFYAKGKLPANPMRRLTNLLVVYSTTSDYEKAQTALVPASMLPKAQPEPAKTAASPVPALTADAAIPVATGLFFAPSITH